MSVVVEPIGFVAFSKQCNIPDSQLKVETLQKLRQEWEAQIEKLKPISKVGFKQLQALSSAKLEFCRFDSEINRINADLNPIFPTSIKIGLVVVMFFVLGILAKSQKII